MGLFKSIKPILENNIVIAWLAPIFTGIVVLVIGKAFALNQKNKKLRRSIQEANVEILNTIRPFVIQKIELNNIAVQAIRNAIAENRNIEEGYLYTDYDLMNQLIYDISNTRFMTEEDKLVLVENVQNMFKDAKVTTKTEAKLRQRKVDVGFIILQIIVVFIMYIISVVVYTVDPDKAENTGSLMFFMVNLPIFGTVILASFIGLQILEIILGNRSSDFVKEYAKMKAVMDGIFEKFKNKVIKKKSKNSEEDKQKD